MAGDRLNGLDVAFLRLDTLASPMIIGAFATFEPAQPIVVGDLYELIAQRLSAIERFQLVAKPQRFPPGTVRWERDPRFDVGAHIRVGYLPAPGNADQLSEYVAQAVARKLDVTRPLWEMHLITGLDNGNFALLARTHHALADASGVAYLIVALVDDAPPLPATADPAGALRLGDAVRAVNRPSQWLTTPTAYANQLATRATESARRTIQWLSVATSVARQIRLAPSSPLLGPPRRISLRRALRTTWLDREPLGQVCEANQVTTHDVVLAVLSGALRRWLERRGHPVDDLRLRALVPVDTRSYNKDAVPGAGNELSGYLCELPVAEPDPIRRLDLVHAEMERNKEAGPYRGPGALGFLASRVPAAVQALATPLVNGNAGLLFDVLVTSGALPTGRWLVAGAPMCDNYGIPPLASGQGLSVAVSKTRHRVGLTLFSDPAIVPDIDVLCDAIQPAFADLGLCLPSQRTQLSPKPADRPTSEDATKGRDATPPGSTGVSS